ncbi:hypothetical protein DFQ03_0109 [Maribacter caenipelagi]|uniref:DUF4149 domain-containing protein n=1 Tax=Maribacter caenipelagi TaxID=1447781 RepID=A0A4R7DJQ8_9FLAO|nr:hypothetical protein [Maribacter caenipelagi]TDS20855.1 hypothetical protein DFQ03_0109 [Maribacter caenipelagi]
MLETIRLICDSGLLVLIWMVQLIIYPSFSYYKNEDLFQWHSSYTKRIAVVVIPLMIAQLIISMVQVFTTPDFNSILYCLLVIGAWLSTFVMFVPLHENISKERDVEKSIKKLKLHNWLRTVLWSLIFMLTCYLKFTSL